MVQRYLAVMLLVFLVTGCSTAATIHRYGGPSLEAEIAASDPHTLVVQDEHGEMYEVPTLTVTEVDHPGTGWMIAGGVLAGIGAMFAYTLDDDAADVTGAVYVGMGVGIGLIGAFPYIRSKMNASGTDLRAGQKLVPASDMPIRRVNEARPPYGPTKRP